MELKDLVGEHKLSGVDTTEEAVQDDYQRDTMANVVSFVLDGITYKAVEDPSDGYRSYCKELEISNEKISNNFPEQTVIGKMKDDSGKCEKDDVIQFFDAITGKIVLEVGTQDISDYYPGCIMNWYPENLAINA